MFKSVFVHNPSTLLIEENSLHESSFGAHEIESNLATPTLHSPKYYKYYTVANENKLFHHIFVVVTVFRLLIFTVQLKNYIQCSCNAINRITQVEINTVAFALLCLSILLSPSPSFSPPTTTDSPQLREQIVGNP